MCDANGKAGFIFKLFTREPTSFWSFFFKPAWLQVAGKEACDNTVGHFRVDK